MNRRKLLVVGSTVLVTLCAIGAACTFPDQPEFTPGGTTGEGGGPEGSTGDADASSDVSNDIQIRVDGGDPDALIEKGDGGTKIDITGCTTCDCDGDGFNKHSNDAGCDAGEDDCDDTDTRIRPDRSYNETPEEPPRNGDWNCKNGVERFYKQGINCGSLGRGAACDALFGFTDTPKCGATGTFVTCKSVGTPPVFLDGACVIGAQSLTYVQACR
jgi:hypothetical protein